jgi:hypothetical protein
MLIKNIKFGCGFSLSNEQIEELGFHNILLALSSRNMIVYNHFALKSGRVKVLTRSLISPLPFNLYFHRHRSFIKGFTNFSV